MRSRGLKPTRLLCPWDSSGKNTGVGSNSLLQGIFLTQGLNHQGSPYIYGIKYYVVLYMYCNIILYLLYKIPHAAVAAKSFQSYLTLCDPIDGSPPGSPVPGIRQARPLEWVAISFSNGQSEKWKWSRSVVSDSSQSHGLQPTRLLRPWDFPGKSTGVGCHCLLLLPSCFSHVRLCATPMDYSLPGFSIHGILQARTLEWGAIAFSNTNIYSLPNSFTSRLPQNIEQSSLCYTVGSCWLSILNIAEHS